MIVLGIKTAMVLVSSFVLTSAVALGVVFLVCSILLFIGSIILMPIYNLNINRAVRTLFIYARFNDYLQRSGVYAAVLWTNICLIFAIVVNDHTNMTPIIVFTAGFLPAAALGVLAVSTSPNNSSHS